MVRKNIFLESVGREFDFNYSKNVSYIYGFIEDIKERLEITNLALEGVSETFGKNNLWKYGSVFLEKIEIFKKELLLMEKFLRKANGYKTIKLKINRDYDRKTAEIIFPKGTKKRFIFEWLKNNGYLVSKNELAPANQLIDCTGALVDSLLEVKNSIATVTFIYDF